MGKDGRVVPEVGCAGSSCLLRFSCICDKEDALPCFATALRHARCHTCPNPAFVASECLLSNVKWEY